MPAAHLRDGPRIGGFKSAALGRLTEPEQRIARAVAKAKEQQHLTDPNLETSEAQADLPLHPLRRAFLRPVPLLLDRLKVATAPL